MGFTKLERLRSTLEFKGASLQKNYNYAVASAKLSLLTAAPDVYVYIQSIEHPFITFENAGDYHGYIAKAIKPTEMNVTFLEDDTHSISRALDLWDNLKYDRAKGIHFPKAVYTDQLILTYSGVSDGGLLWRNERERMKTESGNNNIEWVQDIGLFNSMRWMLLGVYPIARTSQTLSDGDNGVLQINVTFNVDDVKMLI